MKRVLKRMDARRFLAPLTLLVCAAECLAQTTTFTYQGRLTDAGAPASGSYEMQFKLFDATTPGNQTGPTLTFDGAGSNPAAVKVTNGLFSVELDFGAGAFPGAERYLEIGFRRPGGMSFTPLTPRQPLAPTPYAVRSLSAKAADSLAPGCNGCVLDAHIQSVSGDKVTGTVDSATTATSATTAGNVTGVVPVSNGGTGSSTQNFLDLSTNQTIGGDKQFTGAVRVTGGAGVFVGNGAGLSNLNGSNLTDASITQAKLAFATSRHDLQLLGMLRWDLLSKKTIAVGSFPVALAFDGTFIYVATLDQNLTRIRATTGVVEGSPIIVGSSPLGLAFDGTFIYVTSGTNEVKRIRASTGVVEANVITVGNSPRAFAFDGTFMYVANFSSNNVTRIRASTGVVEGDAIAVGNSPRALAFDGTFIYVANSSSNNVTRIRASTGVVEDSPIAVGLGPRALAFDGTFIYVANLDSNNVSRIRASTGVVEGSPIAVGTAPRALAFDSTFIYVANSNSDNVTRIRASTGEVEGSPIAVGSQPYALVFDGTFIYVANINSNSVTRF